MANTGTGANQIPPGGVPRSWIANSRPDIANLADRYADQYGVPRQFVYNIIFRENGTGSGTGNEGLRITRSSAGAEGPMQMIESTRRAYGITASSPLEAQIEAGVHYLSDLGWNRPDPQGNPTGRPGGQFSQFNPAAAAGGYIGSPLRYYQFETNGSAPGFKNTSQAYVVHATQGVVPMASLPQVFQDLPVTQQFRGSSAFPTFDEAGWIAADPGWTTSSFTPVTQQQAGWLEGDPRRAWDPLQNTWGIVNDPNKWNPLTQEQAGWYSGSPELTYRGGMGGQEAGWGYYGDSPIAPFYRLTEEQAGWANASPAQDRPTWNAEQNSWGYWGEPPIDLFPTGRMDYMQQLRDWGISHPGQLQLWDASPERGSGAPGQRSWFDMFNPVGTAHAGLEPLPNFLQGWDPNIGQGGQGALSIFSPSQIWQQWDPNIASGYPGGLTLWDASRPNMRLWDATPLPSVNPGNVGMWDFNAANPLNPFSSQYQYNPYSGLPPPGTYSGPGVGALPPPGTFDANTLGATYPIVDQPWTWQGTAGNVVGPGPYATTGQQIDYTQQQMAIQAAAAQAAAAQQAATLNTGVGYSGITPIYGLTNPLGANLLTFP